MSSRSIMHVAHPYEAMLGLERFEHPPNVKVGHSHESFRQGQGQGRLRGVYDGRMLKRSNIMRSLKEWT